MTDVHFIFATFGELTVKNMIDECHAQSWVPVLIARPKDPKEQTLVPCFKTREHAMQFGARNISTQHLFGTLHLTQTDQARIKTDWVEKRKWRIELFDHPRLIKKWYQFDVEVLETETAPDIRALRTKLGTSFTTLAHTD